MQFLYLTLASAHFDYKHCSSGVVTTAACPAPNSEEERDDFIAALCITNSFAHFMLLFSSPVRLSVRTPVRPSAHVDQP